MGNEAAKPHGTIAELGLPGKTSAQTGWFCQ